jgi:two-component system response regulator YesN
MEEAGMYNVMIVDDEPMIREGLRTLIPWGELGFQVVDIAANGHEALQKFQQFIPDLMIVDIRMPGMNGLELVKSIRDLKLDMHILILSGYADFEYAKEAITYHVDGYLLKPVDEEELMEYLQQLKKQLDEKLNRKVKVEIGSMERVVQSLLMGEDQLTNDNASYKNNLNWASYEVVLVKLITRDEDISAQQVMIKHKLEAQFDDNQRGIVFSMEPYIGIVVKGGIGDKWKQKELYTRLEDICSGNVSDFTAVAGGVVQSWEDIVMSYRKALTIMKSRFFHESHCLVSAESNIIPLLNIGAVLESESLLTEAIERLYLALEVGNLEASLNIITELAKSMKQLSYTEEGFKNMFVQLLTTVVDKFSLHRNEVQSLELRTVIMELHKEQHYRTMLDKMNVIVKSVVDSLGDIGSEKQIKRMIDLIHRNFSENLKLESLADLFNYNSAYLGKLFKQATGDQFNTYLDKVRIEQAKLLLEQDYKVYQVATKVGYANVDYFHTKFRKYVGTSPSNYKKKE